MRRRKWIRIAVAAIFGLLGVFMTAQAVTHQRQPEERGYGSCSRCSCPGFSGSGYTCWRGGCGHHYDSHW